MPSRPAVIRVLSLRRLNVRRGDRRVRRACPARWPMAGIARVVSLLPLPVFRAARLRKLIAKLVMPPVQNVMWVHRPEIIAVPGWVWFNAALAKSKSPLRLYLLNTMYNSPIITAMGCGRVARPVKKPFMVQVSIH